MEASFKTNQKEFQKKLIEYGKRVEDFADRAAIDLSFRAANAVKRDFIKQFSQGPSQGGAGKTARTGRLRSSVVPIVRNQTQFGVSSNVVYARIHEIGGIIKHPGSVARKKKALRFIYQGKVVFAKRTKPHNIRIHARHWMSEPMRKELTVYIDEGKDKLEKKPL
jgi:phage gpG-like protein